MSSKFDTKFHGSFIYLKRESELRVGKICLHLFAGTMTQLACVHFYAKPSTDKDSGLPFPNLNPYTMSVVSLTCLSNQIVLATDADKPETLWLLDC